MLALAIAVASIHSSIIGDYFPTSAGTKWTYQESSDVKLEYSDEALAPQVVLGTSTIPIITKQKNSVLGTNYYLILDDTVYLYACKNTEALPEPQPFFKVGPNGATWEFSGRTPFAGAMLPITLKGSSKNGGKQLVLGLEREVIKVIIDANIEEGGGLVKIKSHSEATYAKGIGMVEMTETVAYTKTKSTRKVKLISFELPK